MSLVIWRKEMRQAFLSPSFYIVLSLCTVLLSWIFIIGLKQFAQNYQTHVFQLGQANSSMHIHFTLFTQHLSYINLLFIIFMPILTMKLIAEERSKGSLKLLLSSPISCWQIIFGKYLAGCTMMFTILCLSFLYPLLCVPFAEIDWPLLLGSYTGMFILGLFYTALGILSSSLGFSVLVSLVIGILLNICVWFLGLSGEITDAQWMRDFLQHLSLNFHVSGWAQGVFRLSSMVFFASSIGFCLFLSERFLNLLKWE